MMQALQLCCRLHKSDKSKSGLGDNYIPNPKRNIIVILAISKNFETQHYYLRKY